MNQGSTNMFVGFLPIEAKKQSCEKQSTLPLRTWAPERPHIGCCNTWH